MTYPPITEPDQRTQLIGQLQADNVLRADAPVDECDTGNNVVGDVWNALKNRSPLTVWVQGQELRLTVIAVSEVRGERSGDFAPQPDLVVRGWLRRPGGSYPEIWTCRCFLVVGADRHSIIWAAAQLAPSLVPLTLAA